jgi:hypothetical protein
VDLAYQQHLGLLVSLQLSLVLQSNIGPIEAIQAPLQVCMREINFVFQLLAILPFQYPSNCGNFQPSKGARNIQFDYLRGDGRGSYSLIYCVFI